VNVKKPRESYISPICRDAPTGAIGLNIDVLGHIADVITHAKFCDNRFRGFGVLIPPILPFSIGIAGRLYNSVSTTVLHCVMYEPRVTVSCGKRNQNVCLCCVKVLWRLVTMTITNQLSVLSHRSFSSYAI